MSSTLLKLLSEWGLAIAGTTASVMTGMVGYVRRIDKRSQQNKRRLEGDADDPNNDGLMQILAETDRKVRDLDDKVDHIEQTQEEHHQQVMQELKEIKDDDSE